MNQMKRDVILKPNRKLYPEKNYSHQELVLHVTLLCRIFLNDNRSRKQSKLEDLKQFNSVSDEELKKYIIHFFECFFQSKETGHSEQDALLEDLWRCFQSVPLTKSEKTVSDWYIFPKETDLGTIRKWFNKRYAGGIVKLSLISLLQETGKDL